MTQFFLKKSLSLVHNSKPLLFASLKTNRSYIYSCNKTFSYSDDASNTTSQEKKKYNKSPPIDLKSIRTNTGKSNEQSNDSSKNTNRIAAFALLSIPIVTLILGAWQIKRREAKLELIKFLQSRTETDPVDLPTDPKVLEKLVETSEYKPFKVKGHFLHSKEILISPRSDLTGSTNFTGANVITPVVVSNDPNLIILVNRGFVPYQNFSPMRRQVAQINDEVEIIGLLRSNLEITNTFTPKNKPPHEWHYRDVNQMAQALNTAPILLDARQDTKTSSIRGGPIGGQTAINIRNEHMSYIITWFSLSALTSYLWWIRFGRVLF